MSDFNEQLENLSRDEAKDVIDKLLNSFGFYPSDFWSTDDLFNELDMSDMINSWNADEFAQYIYYHYQHVLENYIEDPDCAECSETGLSSDLLELVNIKNIPDEDKFKACMKIFNGMTTEQVERLVEELNL